jgi:hypothetical protein
VCFQRGKNWCLNINKVKLIVGRLFSTEMNGQNFLRRPGPTKGCRANDDDDDDDRFGSLRLPRGGITRAHRHYQKQAQILLRLLVACSKGRRNRSGVEHLISSSTLTL